MVQNGRKSPRTELDLDDLAEGYPGITPERGASMAEAAVVCLERARHSSGVMMEVSGDYAKTCEVVWSELGDPEQSARTWADPQEATEHGASAVAAVLVPELTGLVIVERSWKGTGFDYWLGLDENELDNFLEGLARLEVSGIESGGPAEIRKRVRRKEKQTQRSDATKLPAYVTVVEFSSPHSQVTKR